MKEHYVELYVNAENDDELKDILQTIVRKDRNSPGASSATMVDGRPMDMIDR